MNIVSAETRDEDMTYWGLSPAERSRYLGKVSAYYRARSLFYLARAERMMKWPMRISLGLCCIGGAISIMALVAILSK